MSTVAYDGVEYDHDVYSELCPCRGLLDLLANKWSALPIGAPAVPSHVEYSLTDLGHSASVPLALLRAWALENIDNVPHVAVGAHGDERDARLDAR